MPDDEGKIGNSESPYCTLYRGQKCGAYPRQKPVNIGSTFSTHVQQVISISLLSTDVTFDTGAL